ATSFRNCTCVPRTRPYHSIISARRLVFIVTWWSEGLMLVVEVVVMALSFSPQWLLWISTGPGMGLKRRVERRLGDAAGVVRDRGRGACGDPLKEMVLAEARREESIDVLVVETSALFDHRLRQSRQRCEFAVLRRTTFTNGLHIRRINALLES